MPCHRSHSGVSGGPIAAISASFGTGLFREGGWSSQPVAPWALRLSASCLPPCRDEAPGGPGPAQSLAQNTWLGERSFFLLHRSRSQLLLDKYVLCGLCCLTGQGFQIYDCPRARNAKGIPWKLPGACMKPLWHAWACVSGLLRALAGCVWAAMGAAQETKTVLPMADLQL